MTKKKKNTPPVKKPQPKKKVRKRGRPKKRGRKKKYYKKKVNSKSKKSTRNRTNKQYWKVYYRLKRHFDENGYEYSYQEMRKYTQLLYADFKKSDELSGKKHKVSDKTLEAFFDPNSPEKLKAFIIKLGIGLCPPPFIFWELEAQLGKLPNGTYVEIDTATLMGNENGDTYTGNVEDIEAQEIVSSINQFARLNASDYPDKYFWFICEKTADGYYFELVYEPDLDSGFKGAKYVKPEEAEKREKEEKPKEEPTKEEEKPSTGVSEETKRKQKAEADKAEQEVREARAKADTAEIEKLNASIKGLYEELKIQREMDLSDLMKDTLAEIKRLSEKRKKLNE